MPELAEVFRRYGPAYLESFADRMLPSHRRAFEDIIECRTEALGGHLAQCDRCGHQHYSYHSCRNRSCPKCHGTETKKWLGKRRAELLPATVYFHVVFTIPKELHSFVRTHQKTLYGLLIKAAALSLIKLTADPKYVGGKIGILAVLHTWTRAMAYHPHVHCLVPGGGLSDDRKCWLAARNNFLVPKQPLSILFRAIFMRMARKALPHIHFPESVWETKWVVFPKPTLQGTHKLLDYLARYVHRIAITNNRILALQEGKVTFRYKDSRNHCTKTMTLPALEFIRRFLQHVLPVGLHKVRYYGLFSPCHRHLLRQLQLLLFIQNVPEESNPLAATDPINSVPEPRPSTCLCPLCRSGLMVLISWIPRRARGPP